MDFSPSVYEHAARFVGRSPWEVSRDPDLLFHAHAAAYRRYRHVPITVGIDIYNLEAEAYGAVVNEPQGKTIPAVSEPLFSSVSKMKNLKGYDPRDGRPGMVISVGRRLAEELPGAKVRIPVSGPFSISGLLLGLERLLLALVTEPEEIYRVLLNLAHNQLVFCEEIIRQGLGITFFESGATPPLVSPAHFDKIVRPVLKELLQNIKSLTKEPAALIIGGDTFPILDSILDTGAEYLICPFETDQPAFFKKLSLHPGVYVRVNVNPKIIAKGVWKDIEAEISRVVHISKGRDKVCIGTGALPYETDPENVVKMIDWIKRE
jgi:uroporphyrinogen-III decarboxylase